MQGQNKIKLVILESPFAGRNQDGTFSADKTKGNIKYAQACAKHCAYKGEASQASHLYYTQFLDDQEPEERTLGIALGLAWTRVADYQVFYTDRGWSPGMLRALELAMNNHKEFKIRALHSAPKLPDGSWSEEELRLLLSCLETVELDLDQGQALG